MVKRLRKSVLYILRYSTECASFFAVSYQTYTNELCQLWSYWTNEGVCHFSTKLVAMATSLEVSEKEVQIDRLHPKRFHSVIDCENRSSKS